MTHKDDMTPPIVETKDLGHFPQGFLFGSATAPYQVEGNLHMDDWHQWEQMGKIVTGESADNGPDHWSLYDSDFTMAQQLGHNAYRMGIDWGRLFPTAAQFPNNPDPNAVAHYHQMLQSAKSHGLKVMVTLFHFVLPTWIQDM